MDREEAIEIIRKNMPSDKSLPVYEALQTIIPELAESEDERIRKWILDYAIEMIAGLESDISLSNYDGIKGHDPEAEAELAQWQKARAYLEKQKEPHYTKRNALFDKCVENCDPDVMKSVYNEVDKMLEKEQKSEGWSEEFEKNIHELLYNKLRWDSEDGRISTAVFIDDKTLKDIVTGIWFYVGKEAMKNPNMELPKQEWSNEDEEKLKAICTYLRDYSRLAKINDVKRFNAYCDWLRSLRPSWKPSEEQMKALCNAIAITGTCSSLDAVNTSLELESLREQLKKLM